MLLGIVVAEQQPEREPDDAQETEEVKDRRPAHTGVAYYDGWHCGAEDRAENSTGEDHAADHRALSWGSPARYHGAGRWISGAADHAHDHAQDYQGHRLAPLDGQGREEGQAGGQEDAQTQ